MYLCFFMSKIIENYVLEESLGEDAYGFDVFRARHTHSNEHFTIYCISRAVFDSPTFFKGAVDNQIEICKKLNHPNLLRFVKLIKTAHNSYSVWEYCEGGTLFDRILKDSGKNLDQLKVMKQLAAGLRQMHKQNIIHMNLHPQNILLTLGDNVKIANFSNSRNLNSTTETMNYDLKTIKLNDLLAPELLEGKPATLKSDVYSLGLVFGFIKYGSFEFENELSMGLKLKDPIAELIHKMLNPQPSERISAQSTVVSLASSHKQNSSLSMNKSFKTISGANQLKSSDTQQSDSSKIKARACTPTSAGVDRSNGSIGVGLQKFKNLNTSKDSSSTSVSKLGTLAAQRREREKDMSTDTKSIVEGDFEEKLIRTSVRKILKERNKYFFLLYVAQEVDAMNLHKLSINISFLLIKKACIQLKKINLSLKSKDATQNQDLAELNSIIDAQIHMIKDYYRMSCNQLSQEDIKSTPHFAKQLEEQDVISENFLHKLIKQYVNYVLVKINSELKSRSMRSLQAGPQKNMLIHLLNILHTKDIDHFCDSYLNDTILRMQQQVYFKQIQQFTLMELSGLVNSKV